MHPPLDDQVVRAIRRQLDLGRRHPLTRVSSRRAGDRAGLVRARPEHGARRRDLASRNPVGEARRRTCRGCEHERCKPGDHKPSHVPSLLLHDIVSVLLTSG